MRDHALVCRAAGCLAAALAVALVPCVSGCVAARRGAEPRIATVEVYAATADAPGGLAGAIEAANASNVPVRIVSRLPRGTEVGVARELPWISGAGITLHGNGLALRDRGCVRRDGRLGCSGLVVTGTGVTVRDVEASGFRFDGISVRRANGVLIADSRLWGNLDDGVGVSEVSKSVTIYGCQIESNGFRSKGKGVLVFDESDAVLRDNVIVGNRDGVTISKRSHAILENNRIVDSFDKGLGIAAASAEGRGNVISGSGRGARGLAPGPNADGLRATLDSSVRLENSAIIESGDAGVVAEGRSRVELVGVRMAGNHGGDVRAGPDATVIIDGRVWPSAAGESSSPP